MRAQVLESWRVILRGMPMDISLEDVRVCARDGAAFVTCVEIMEAGDSRGRCNSPQHPITLFPYMPAAEALHCCSCVLLQGLQWCLFLQSVQAAGRPLQTHICLCHDPYALPPDGPGLAAQLPPLEVESVRQIMMLIMGSVMVRSV